MMETKDSVGKDMMMKLKESFSIKSFSSKRYHSALICKSKTIRMDMNLIDQNDLTSAGGFSVSKFTVKNSENISAKNQETSSSHEKNLENSEVMNTFTESSSVMKNSPESENMAELLKIGDSLKSSSESEKFKLKISVKHLYQANSQGSSNPIQTKSNSIQSKYESFRCDVCMKYLSSQRSVKRHSIKHSLEKHPCEICGKVFPTREDLEKHHKAIHEVDERKPRCSKCNKAYSRKANLNRHLKRYPDHVQLSPLIISSSPTDLLLDLND